MHARRFLLLNGPPDGPSAGSPGAARAARVRTPLPGVLDWLAESAFTAGALQDDAEALPAQAVVTAVADRERFAGLAAAAADAREDVVCFTLDGPERRVPRVRERVRNGAVKENGVPFAVDLEFRSAVAASHAPDGTLHVEIVAESDRPDARLATMRVLRELASGEARRAGALLLHASALEDDAGVTLLCGARRSGKSTLLLHALARGDVHYVSNDRAFATPASAERRRPAHAEAAPTIVSLREGSLACLPEAAGLADEIASGAWHYASSLDECRRNRREGLVAEGSGYRKPPGLSPAQLCALLGVPGSSGAPLARIVFPRVEPDTRGFALTRLSDADARARLLETGLVASGRAATFLDDAAPPEIAALEARADALVREVPCFACSLGAGAYEAPSAWDAIRKADAGPR